ncbi:MAG TPA: 50S ribosomal protein L2, partial [Gammaproteobacteria bacterium]|nr:50S ribosomal protein L2 [Gammaproteobacteria bacterium]
MANQIKKSKPTSPGRRFRSWVSREGLHKGSGFQALLESKKQKSGRNNKGRITSRHRGGGHKKNYRVIDFKRDKDSIKARVERLEYDPNRSANIALVLYQDGERRYIIAPEGLNDGDVIESGS